MVSGVTSGNAMIAAIQARMQGAVKGAQNSQDLFAKLDKSGDGSIDKTELKSFLDYVGNKAGSDQSLDADALFSALDGDGDGKLSSQELADGAKTLFDMLQDQLRSAQVAQAPRPLPPNAEDMFKAIDVDQDGSISKVELTTFLEARPAPPGGPEGSPGIDEILAKDDSDGNGQISLDEFKAAMESRGPMPPSGDDAAFALLASLIDQYLSSTAEQATGASTVNVTA